MEILVFIVLIGLLPAAIAASKGRSFVLWWLYGAALFIVALPHALIIGKDQAALDAKAISGGAVKKCPQCAEVIKREAKVCRFCGADVSSVAAAGPPDIGAGQY